MPSEDPAVSQAEVWHNSFFFFFFFPGGLPLGGEPLTEKGRLVELGWAGARLLGSGGIVTFVPPPNTPSYKGQKREWTPTTGVLEWPRASSS